MQKERSKRASVYRAYTTKFDRVVNASDLDSVLGPLTSKNRRTLDEAWRELQSGLLPWKTKVHIASGELTERICSDMSREERENAVVSLLFDQSGSMRGQKMLFSAASADVAQEFLVNLGIGCEVLGFTTSDWRGGRSRRRWNWRFRPHNPGRLSDLLHVVYRDVSDNCASTGGWIYRQMLRADLPKENIDGEAIEWAASRLRSIPRKRKILIVLSDGAPVDDSTLNENGPEYLGDHLLSVVEDLKSEGEIEIAAFGIGFACHRFYPKTHNVENPSDLGIELLRLLTGVLLKSEDVIPL